MEGQLQNKEYFISWLLKMKAGYYEKENPIGNDVDDNAAVGWRLLLRSWRLWLGWSSPRSWQLLSGL
jgi:hypothetical protein